MATFTGITLQSSIDEILAEADIVNTILPPHDAPFVHPDISWYEDPTETGNSDVVRWVRELSGTELDEDEMSFTTPKPEGDDGGYGDAIEFNLAGVEATGRLIGVKRQLSFQVGYVAKLDFQTVVLNSQQIVRKRIARDQAAVATGATNLSNLSGQYLTRKNWGRALAYFKDQKPTGMFGFVGSPGQIQCLREDLADSAASSLVGDMDARAMLDQTGMASFVGRIDGVPIFEGHYNEAYDANNDTGYFATLGDKRGALGVANWFTKDDPAQGIVGGFRYEVEWDPEDDCWYLWAKAYCAHAITDQANIRLLVSRKLLT
jgi:hypothetical protein